MLSKIHRLKKEKEFKTIYRKGMVSDGDFLYLRWLKNEYNYSRFGIVISAKIAKANKRVVLKRKISEILRTNLDNIKIGFDLVFIVKKFNSDWLKPKDQVFDLLKKSKIWKKPCLKQLY